MCFDHQALEKKKKNFGSLCWDCRDCSSLLYDRLETLSVLLTRPTYFLSCSIQSMHSSSLHPGSKRCRKDFVCPEDWGRGHVVELFGTTIWKHSLIFLVKELQRLFLKTVLCKHPWVIVLTLDDYHFLSVNDLSLSHPVGEGSTSRQLVKELLRGVHRSYCLSTFFVKIKGASVSIISLNRLSEFSIFSSLADYLFYF